MFKEIALEPALFAKSTYRDKLKSLIGVKEFRFVRDYPKDWSNEVRNAFRKYNNALELTALSETLIAVKPYIVECFYDPTSMGTFYDRNYEWISNAENYDKKEPFDCILAESNPNCNKKIIDHNSLSSHSKVCLEEHELLDNSKSYIVHRDPESMALAVKTLLKVASEIHFVDPFLAQRCDERFIKPLQEFINILAVRVKYSKKPVTVLRYHTAEKGAPDSVLKQNLEYYIKNLLPDKLPPLEIVRWRDIHNRFILTDRGGVSFGHGLDMDNDPEVMDNINSLPVKACREVTEKKGGNREDCYMTTTRKPSFEIEGTKK